MSKRKEKGQVPKTIGIIMDGNRRYAKGRGLSSIEGHWKGYQNFKSVLEWSHEAGVKHIIAYAFSTENWKRTKKEVQGLVALFYVAMKELEEKLKKTSQKIGAIRFIGDLSHFPEKVQELAYALEKKSKGRKGLSVVLALSYGGRAEILRAAELSKGKNEHDFEKGLFTSGVPDPDMILRTGGEQRLSNFLLWQAAYSELFFTDTLWPEFSKQEFLKILKEFTKRKRNFGK